MIRAESVTLTREQLEAILENTSGVVTIEQTHTQFTHTYVQDSDLKKQNRSVHVSLKGNVLECELSTRVSLHV